MDLTTSSQQTQQDKFLTIKRQSGYYLGSDDVSDDIIDLSNLNLENDETWLYCVGSDSKSVSSLSEFLQGPTEANQRNIDTRTFTRPKKRFTRPSIEKYNQELYGTGEQNELSTEISKKSLDSGTVLETNETPLQFDLAQPTSSYYFENVLLAKANEANSFQSMSPPPSLVNSMSSSIFTNLMESSFIKNDPELREIRDKDFSDSILLQDCEPPMFQSISDSISSVNSDSPEAFLRRISREGEAKEKNHTFDVNTTFDITPNNKSETLNDTVNNYTTYRRTPKHSNTFRKSDGKRISLNSTFDVDTTPKNSTFEISGSTTITKDNSAFLKQKLMEDVKHINDLNKLSYCINNGKSNGSPNETVLKRNSIGSADSLDRMSSLSNSSRGSNKMLNMAEVDAIVEMQEKSLQVMSTPKPGIKKAWDGNYISPIIPDNSLSDSDEVSSLEDYKSVKSGSKTSLDNHKIAQKFGFSKPVQPKKVLPKSVFTMPKKVANPPSSLRGSYSNIHAMSQLSGSQSNLKTMGQRLKGSYTSLRPISANLPVAPPPLRQQQGLNSTMTLPKATNMNVTQLVEPRVAQVPPITKVPAQDPLQKPRSGLPRPVGASGLPRPVSRIPAPKSNIRY